ncbi:ribbon-helix-helix protein, CopG family [Kribbella sp. NPDC059898]|jgi:acetolactate synthase small subunit|uniref:ribbon-helix-helix protein, CopG family n=1 Tax=Kribbella sp. NPDC059898 TaxID=3346995 RepID=UPI003652303E
MGRRGPKSRGDEVLAVVPVRLPPAQREALRRLAAADGASVSDLAREAFTRYLATRQEDLVAS